MSDKNKIKTPDQARQAAKIDNNRNSGGRPANDFKNDTSRKIYEADRKRGNK